MSAIVPDSTIILCKNTGLDPAYKHTIYFSNSTEQHNYFVNKGVATFNAQSYQRVNEGTLRVQVQTEGAYSCDYLMFQNSGFSQNRWFYAFITDVKYINNSVTEFSYEIDVMQSWFFNAQLQQCYVVREHCQVNDRSSCYTPEPFDVGEAMPIHVESLNLNQMNVVVISSPQNTVTTAHSIYNNYFAGTYSDIFPNTSVSEISSFINQQIEANNDIVAMYEFPSVFYNPTGDPPTKTLQLSNTKPQTLHNGYIPKNKKMFYYPFTFVRLSDHNGHCNDYAYEFFNGDTTVFNVECIHLPNTTVIAYPLNYKGFTTNYEEKMVMTDFPICCWSNNGFEQWWANNKEGVSANILASAISVGVSAMSGNPQSMLNSAVGATNTMINTAADIAQAVNLPNNLQGNTSSACVNAGLGQQKIRLYTMSVEYHRAMVIDDFFQKFGYATNRIKTPNRNVRPYYTYTQTKDCCIVGDVPAPAKKKLCQIYDTGITFWKNGATIGDYSVANGDNQQA